MHCDTPLVPRVCGRSEIKKCGQIEWQLDDLRAMAVRLCAAPSRRASRRPVCGGGHKKPCLNAARTRERAARTVGRLFRWLTSVSRGVCLGARPRNTLLRPWEHTHGWRPVRRAGPRARRDDRRGQAGVPTAGAGVSPRSVGAVPSLCAARSSSKGFFLPATHTRRNTHSSLSAATCTPRKRIKRTRPSASR